MKLVILILLVYAAACSNMRAQSSVSSHEPGAQVTKQANEWINRCIRGDWDWTQFGNQPDDAPSDPRTKHRIENVFKKILAPYGALKSMQYLNQSSFITNEGHARTSYEYRVALERGSIIFVFSKDKDGRTGGVFVDTGKSKYEFFR